MTPEEQADKRFPGEFSPHKSGSIYFPPSWRQAYASCLVERAIPAETENALLKDTVKQLVEANSKVLSEYEDRDVQMCTPIAYFKKFAALEELNALALSRHGIKPE